MERKGQAAMEFLMTYGWAILAAIIVIGVLAFYFRPSGFTGSQSRLNAPLYLIAGSLGPTTSAQVEIRNDHSDTINVTLINATTASGAFTCDDAPSTAMTVGEQAVFTLTCNPALTAGDDYQFDLSVRYRVGSSTIDQTATGILVGKAQ